MPALLVLIAIYAVVLLLADLLCWENAERLRTVEWLFPVRGTWLWRLLFGAGLAGLALLFGMLYWSVLR